MTHLSQAHEEWLSAALALPLEARAEIAERLLDSLDADRAAIDTTWGLEAERRVDQLDRGEGELISGDKAIAELRSRCRDPHSGAK